MKKTQYDYINDSGKEKLMQRMLEQVKSQLRDSEPPYVAEFFQKFQQKGFNRKEAKTLIASELIQLKDFDQQAYQKRLEKLNRTLTDSYQVGFIITDLEEEINTALNKMRDFMMENDDESAADMFSTWWPKIKDYVIDNFYRESKTGLVKPALEDISLRSEYELDFDMELPEMLMVYSNAKRYEEAYEYGRQLLELFSWDRTDADTIKTDMGEVLANAGRLAESDAWFEQCLREEPGNGNYVNAYAFVHQIQGNLARAREIVEAHLPEQETIEEQYENLYLRAAEVYKELGETEKEAHYRRLLEEVHSSLFGAQMAEADDWWKQKPVVKAAKVYPNDPCPCGSGKKYKKCCGRE